MRLSFVLPVYNAEKYIENCLDSLYAQELDENDFEVVCINDGSTDNSLQTIINYQAHHRNLRVKSIENSGVSAARNVGIREATGAYIFFVDSDDYIANGCIKELLEVATNLSLDMLYFDSYRVKDNSHRNCRYVDESQNHLVLSGKEFFAQNFPGNGPWLFLIRREFVLSEALFFEEGRRWEDGMFVILSTNRAKKISYCHTDVYRYVFRANSFTTLKSKEHLLRVIDDFVYVIQYINAIIGTAIDERDQEKYIERLVDRRNSYTFFLQVRMMKAKLDRKNRSERLSCLKEEGCYPNQGLTADYGKKMVLLSKIFQSNAIYNLLCEVYAILK